MKIRHLIVILLFLTIGTKSFATHMQSFIVYRLDTAYCNHIGHYDIFYEYLRPEVIFGNYGSSRCLNLADFLGIVIESDKVKYKDGILHSIFIDADELSYIEEKEYITTLLMNGIDEVTIVFKNGTERKYTKKDITLPFFLPVYFGYGDTFYGDIDDADHEGFIRNALDMMRIVDKQVETDFKYFLYHKVAAGETLFGISKRYGISQNEIIKYNPILETSTLQAGQKIIIYYNEESPYYDYLVNQDNNITTENKPNKPNIFNIVLFILLGLSFLLNIWLVRKFYISAQNR